MSMPRRGFLISVGTAASLAIAGCVDDETIPGSDESGEDASPTDRSTVGPSAQESVPNTSVLLNRTVTIEEDDFIAKDFTLGSRTRFSYKLTVENDVPVDLFVIKNTGFLKYKRGQSIDPEVTVLRTDDDAGEFVISDGNYYVVVDHTDTLKAEPPGGLKSVPAEVDVEITY